MTHFQISKSLLLLKKLFGAWVIHFLPGYLFGKSERLPEPRGLHPVKAEWACPVSKEYPFEYPYEYVLDPRDPLAVAFDTDAVFDHLGMIHEYLWDVTGLWGGNGFGGIGHPDAGPGVIYTIAIVHIATGHP